MAGCRHQASDCRSGSRRRPVACEGQRLGDGLVPPERAASSETTMTPVWSPEAIDDLAVLPAYIEQDDPSAARRVALHIIENVIENVETLLPGNPEIGRPGRVPGTRELVIPRTPFIVA